DTVDVVLRDDSDGFGTDRTTASVRPAPQLREQRSVHGRGAREPVRAGEPHEFYGTTFFHSGRFRRLIRYDLLSAFRVRAWIRAEHAGAWFSAFHSNQLLLGDPGAHDATLHVLLACVPHRKALPVGADRVTVWRKPSGVLRVEADELSHTADEYVFNVDLTEPDGAVVARWEGLRLRAITPPQRPETLPVSLVGPWLSRRLIECEFADRIGLMTAPRTRQSHATAGLVQLLTGGSAGHDPAGALRADGHHAGASYAGGTLLLAVANQPVGIDWEAVRPDPAPAGPDSGDFADHAVAELLADKLGEAPTLTRLRVWSAREALCKLGYDQSEPLRVDRITEDGLAILTSGNDQVATARLRTNGPGATPVKVVALACRRGGARA
ncbi:MAG: polyketide synthase dehydratase domain-containing protein, partial [Haloechinothrix sp.]